MRKIIKGATVEIINPGSYFPNHSTAAKKLKATKWFPGISPKKDQRGTVVNTWTDDRSQVFYLIDLVGIEIIISREGIKLISEWDEKYNSKMKIKFMGADGGPIRWNDQ